MGMIILVTTMMKAAIFAKRIGMLFQHAALFDSLTVYENVAFPLRERRYLKSVTSRKEWKKSLSRLDFQKLPKSFLGVTAGEKKRVGLARALAPKPKILLYDEPTRNGPVGFGNDPSLIVQVNKDSPDLTSVVISHDLKAALDTANVIMLYKRKVQQRVHPRCFVTLRTRSFASFSLVGLMALWNSCSVWRIW